MASPKVHCTLHEAGGSKLTYCARVNPPHSTVSLDWVTCKPCLVKLGRWDHMLNQKGY